MLFMSMRFVVWVPVRSTRKSSENFPKNILLRQAAALAYACTSCVCIMVYRLNDLDR